MWDLSPFTMSRSPNSFKCDKYKSEKVSAKYAIAAMDGSWG